MAILVDPRMDERDRSRQNRDRSGEIFATSGVFMSRVPPNKKATHRPGGFLQVDASRQRQDTEVFNLVDRHKQW
jgi:hypothetical protein